MQPNQGWSDRHVRSVFLSDVHIGSRHSQCHELVSFLEELHPERLYIVGDLIDGWLLQRSFYWLPIYDRLIELLIEVAAKGTRVYYVPGNHDAFVQRDDLVKCLVGQFDFLEVASEFVYETVHGQRFLVIHGDRFDYVEQSAHWLSVGVTGIYNTFLSLNWWFTRLTRRGHRNPYRLCGVIEDRIKKVIRLISRFERALIEYARQRGCQGVICGHLHTPSIVQRDGIVYCNTGDWVENCTALLEYQDGSFELQSYYRLPAVAGWTLPRASRSPARPSEVPEPTQISTNQPTFPLASGGSRG